MTVNGAIVAPVPGWVAAVIVLVAPTFAYVHVKVAPVAEESVIVAGEEGYYCETLTGSCNASGAPPQAGATNYHCDKSQRCHPL